MRKIICFLIVCTLLANFSFAQTPTNKLESTGNAGIGTTSPTAKLEIATSTNEILDAIRIGSTASGNNGAHISFQGAGGGTITRLIGSYDNTYGGSFKFQTARVNYPIADAMMINGNGSVLIGANAPMSTEKLRVNGDTYMDGNLTISSMSSILFGANAYPHGHASIGYEGTNGALLYHYQMNDGLTMKVDMDANNTSPVVNVSGNGAYINTGLFNINYNHYNSAYSTVGYKANMSVSNTSPGGEVVGFKSTMSAVAGEAFGGYLSAQSTGSGNVYGLYVDSYLGTGGSGNTWGVYVNRGKSYFNGYVGIGTNNPQAMLSVNGDVLAKKVKVTQTGWADYVFDNRYKLPSLKEVDEYIKKHHHLPDMPSAEKVKNDGLDVGDNQAILLKKIEELTLYIIDLNKKVQKLEGKENVKNHR